MWHACRRVDRKRMAFEELRKEEARMAEFEESLDSVHENHLNALMATRMQSGARMGMARGYNL